MKDLLATVWILMMFLAASCGQTKQTESTQNSTQDTVKVMNDSTKVCNASAEEIAGISKALDLYVEAAVKGDSKIAQSAFAPTATISYSEDGKLVSNPIKALYDYYDQTGPHPASYNIVACEVAQNVAVVRIDSKFGDVEFDDMFTLVKDGNDWKIVSKIYHAR